MKVYTRAATVSLVLLATGLPATSHGIAHAARMEPDRAVFHATGNGISNTQRFRVPGTWRIAYRYWNCQIPGFDIYVKGGPNDIASDSRSSGSGNQYEYGGGSVYLTLNTACSWAVTAYSGYWVVNGPGLVLNGNSITNTVAFRVPSEWSMHYSYWKCAIPGFDIYVNGDAFDIMSKEGSRGSGVQYEHDGGTVHLSINTSCFWQIKIAR